MVEAAWQALAAAGLERNRVGQLVAGVGIAGVNVPHFYGVMSAWEHPFRQLYLTTDTHIACLGAHGDGSGAVLVVGTGSVGYAIAGSTVLSVGGHGFPFGDAGSGAWLGLEHLLLILQLSATCGAVVGIALIVLRDRDRSVPLPFGPYLSVAGWCSMLWGESLMREFPILAPFGP